jgi:hypothetical protein
MCQEHWPVYRPTSNWAVNPNQPQIFDTDWPNYVKTVLYPRPNNHPVWSEARRLEINEMWKSHRNREEHNNH